MGKWIDAVTYAKEALSRDPRMDGCELLLVKALRANGRTLESVDRLRELKQRAARDPSIQLEFARALAMSGEVEAAQHEYQMLLREHPKSEEARDELAALEQWCEGRNLARDACAPLARCLRPRFVTIGRAAPMPHPDSQATTAKNIRQPPNLPWRRVGAVGALVFALSLSSVEAIWRSRGYRPTVPESLELWHFWRERVRSADGHVVAVLGTSRVMADISLATMSQCLPSRRIVQLGISGSISSVKILNDLLDDPKFVGTVICELDTPLLDRTSWGGHEQYLEFRPPPFPAYSEIILRDLVDDRLISLRSPCTLRGALMRFFGNQREFLRDEPRQTFRREWQYDFSTVADLETLAPQYHCGIGRALQATPFSNMGRPTHRGRRVERGREAIPSAWRSGRVSSSTFYRRAMAIGRTLPLEKGSLGPLFRVERRNLHSFSRRSRHANLQCPDDSHLDLHDAPAFTRALIVELTRRVRR